MYQDRLIWMSGAKYVLQCRCQILASTRSNVFLQCKYFITNCQQKNQQWQENISARKSVSDLRTVLNESQNKTETHIYPTNGLNNECWCRADPNVERKNQQHNNNNKRRRINQLQEPCVCVCVISATIDELTLLLLL